MKVTVNKLKGKQMNTSVFRLFWNRVALLTADEAGMSTVEYAIGTVAAAAFGGILYSVVTGDSIVGALTNIIARALSSRG